MGEFADMALSETMDMEDLRFMYRSGSMSDFEAYDAGILDERGFEDRTPMFRSAPRTVTCRYCGTTGFRWHSTADGWRLASKGVIHTCDRYKGS